MYYVNTVSKFPSNFLWDHYSFLVISAIHPTVHSVNTWKLSCKTLFKMFLLYKQFFRSVAFEGIQYRVTRHNRNHAYISVKAPHNSDKRCNHSTFISQFLSPCILGPINVFWGKGETNLLLLVKKFYQLVVLMVGVRIKRALQCGDGNHVICFQLSRPLRKKGKNKNIKHRTFTVCYNHFNLDLLY